METVKYNSEFHALKHFLAIVMPGAKRIAVSGGPLKETAAFQNPDGSKDGPDDFRDGAGG
jgi:hypothetical protein